LVWSVDIFSLPDQALQTFDKRLYDLVVLDWNLPYMRGDEFLERADKVLSETHGDRILNKPIPVVICSSLPADTINPPMVTNFLFSQWHKGLPFSSLVSSLKWVTNEISGRAVL
jgi:hypothetical protein